MSTDEADIDDKILELIAEQADEKNIPEDLLIEIYKLEDRMVEMGRREGLPKKLRKILQGYVDEDNEISKS
ncbi:DNA modification system-associated small protein [Halorarum salinum]|uniref:Uncharacterized protein n=1 Tax=Halorarum salinum TaxID=2743089 RepID=A0A7D5QB68_9EURY|nr:DNA modification system-associated small protein [Halobaculum salinum]QLG62019.1 hypothetical protein HUG12_09900 [Halobaculum salinum]